MKEAFCGFDDVVITSVSPWLMNKAEVSPILCDKKHAVVLNGLDTEIFHFTPSMDTREKLAVGNKKVLFYVTPSLSKDPNHIKGGYHLFELARRMTDALFVVAGPYADGLMVPRNVILLGKVSDQKDLSKLYSMADLTVLVSKKETFSMVVAESLCCGTPVVGFKAGGPETITIDDYSCFIDNGNIVELERVCRSFLEKTFDKNEISKRALEKFSKERMASSFIEIYKGLIENR